MAFRKYTGTTASDINVDELIEKAKGKEIDIDSMHKLAEDGRLSSSDLAKILIDGFDILKRKTCPADEGFVCILSAEPLRKALRHR